MNTKGNTILITGGGSGIGGGLAEAFHKLGNKVIIGGRRKHVLDEAAARHPGMETVVMDTSDAESVKQAAAEVLARFPELNVIINNAGVQKLLDFGAEPPVDEKQIEQEIDTNIYGVLRMTNAFLPHLKTRPSATIINLSSGLAFLPIARYPVYCATKAFVHSFTMSLRFQLRNSNVRVIELAPPWVKTELDASHGVETEHEGMQPMPLADFIDAAMQDLASDKDELPVAGAKFLYAAGISEKARENFEQFSSR